jgi:Fe-S oxidoreductase
MTFAGQMQKNIKAIDVFIAEEMENGRIKGKLVAKSKDVLLHGHCHQKASFGTKGMTTLYQQMDKVNLSVPDSGCCGMAGSFGYEKEHFEVSKTIGENVLLPAVRQCSQETMIVANGFSCRHQIADFSDKKAVHWVESVEWKP